MPMLEDGADSKEQSVAISLKRIADSLEALTDLDGPHHSLLNLVYEMGKSFASGSRDKR